jgi:hypothetical protein
VATVLPAKAITGLTGCIRAYAVDDGSQVKGPVQYRYYAVTAYITQHRVPPWPCFLLLRLTPCVVLVTDDCIADRSCARLPDLDTHAYAWAWIGMDGSVAIILFASSYCHSTPLLPPDMQAFTQSTSRRLATVAIVSVVHALSTRKWPVQPYYSTTTAVTSYKGATDRPSARRAERARIRISKPHALRMAPALARLPRDL